jgi:pimeloyl-ACP methyl ester carboxylesterase
MRKSYSFIKVGDLDIHYELADYTAPWRTDAPETFLLYHGYARNLHFWQQWVPLLAGNYRVLRFDARGCGDTTKPPPASPLSLELLAQDAVGLMDALGIGRVHWVGESSGGVVGITTALEYPDRIASLTLCDTPFKRAAAVTSGYSVGEGSRAAALEKYGVAEWCRRTLAYRVDVTKLSPEACEWYIEEMGRTPTYLAIELGELFGSRDLWPRLPEVRAPALLLAGTTSQVAPAEAMKAMQQRMRHAKLVAFEGYGQNVNLTAPERCVDEVLKFVRDLRIAQPRTG